MKTCIKHFFLITGVFLNLGVTRSRADGNYTKTNSMPEANDTRYFMGSRVTDTNLLRIFTLPLGEAVALATNKRVDIRQRLVAIQRLGDGGPREADCLRNLLNDKLELIFQAAACALLPIEREAPVSALKAHITKNVVHNDRLSFGGVCESAKILAAVNEDTGYLFLTGTLGHTNDDFAICAMARLAFIVDGMKDYDFTTPVCMAIEKRLEKGDRALDKSDLYYIKRAFGVLEHQRDERAIPYLEVFVSNNNAIVSEQAKWTLDVIRYGPVQAGKLMGARMYSAKNVTNTPSIEAQTKSSQ